MHAVRVELLPAQADALGLPLWQTPIPSRCSNGEYERAMEAAVRRGVTEGFSEIAFGDLFLEDTRRNRAPRSGSDFRVVVRKKVRKATIAGRPGWILPPPSATVA